MTLPVAFADMLDELPTRLGRAQGRLAHYGDISQADDPVVWLTQLVHVARDLEFIQDIAATVPLFIPRAQVPLPLELIAQLKALGGRALHWCADNPQAEFVPFQKWLQGFSAASANPSLPQGFVQFLNETAFAHDGFDVTLIELWQLTRMAPNSVTPQLRDAFFDRKLAIADRLAACLAELFRDDARYHEILATPLELSIDDVQRLLRFDVPAETAPCAQSQLSITPDQLLRAAYDHLIQSNISGTNCKAIFDAGHVVIGPPGPDFSFTVQPDPSRPPIIYLPFTGHANDVTLLCHQLGHGLHQWRAAQNSVAPVLLPPALDEIIPSYFETHADAIRSKLTGRSDQERAKWHDELRRYQALAHICEAAQQGTLTGDMMLSNGIDLFDLIFDGQLFPALPLSSSAWGHLVAAQYCAAGGSEAGLMNIIAPSGADAVATAVFREDVIGGIPGKPGMPIN
jgi:hypothetical protein